MIWTKEYFKVKNTKQSKLSLSTKTKGAKIIVKGFRKIVAENKILSLNKIEEKMADNCSHCHSVVCFIPKLQQIMNIRQVN